MSVTVSEVLVAARSGLAAVSSETAGYLVLGTADCLGDAPFGIASVYLDEDGALQRLGVVPIATSYFRMPLSGSVKPLQWAMMVVAELWKSTIRCKFPVGFIGEVGHRQPQRNFKRFRRPSSKGVQEAIH